MNLKKELIMLMLFAITCMQAQNSWKEGVSSSGGKYYEISIAPIGKTKIKTTNYYGKIREFDSGKIIIEINYRSKSTGPEFDNIEEITVRPYNISPDVGFMPIQYNNLDYEDNSIIIRNGSSLRSLRKGVTYIIEFEQENTFMNEIFGIGIEF